MTAVLIIGDWGTWCGVCGDTADYAERRHITVFGGPREPDGGCGAEWTHVAAERDSHTSGDRLREMRPDLVVLPEPWDHHLCREVA